MKDFRISLSNNNIVIITVRSKDLSLAVLVKKTKDIMIKQNKRWRRLTGEWKTVETIEGLKFYPGLRGKALRKVLSDQNDINSLRNLCDGYIHVLRLPWQSTTPWVA